MSAHLVEPPGLGQSFIVSSVATRRQRADHNSRRFERCQSVHYTSTVCGILAIEELGNPSWQVGHQT